MKNLFTHPTIQKRAKELKTARENILKKGLDPTQFCIMPFVNLILEPDGSVGLCRQKGSDFTLGYIQEDSIENIWNGPFARRWRREFLEGKPHICNSELRHKGCQLCPSLNSMLEDVQLSEVQESFPLRLTANFNGKCNLQCQMCDVWQMPNGLYTDLNFWEPAKKSIFPHLKEIDMLSGEPFIQPDTYRLIDEVSSVNPNCSWSITTNLHWNLSQRIKDYLDKIKVKNIIVSIDSLVPESYAKIRYPGKLAVVLETFKNLKEYEVERIARGLGPLNIHVNFLIQKENWREASSMIEFCLKNEAMPFLTFLYRPSQFSLNDLNYKERLNILDYYFKNSNWSELSLMRRVWTPLIERLEKIDKAHFFMLITEKKREHQKSFGDDFIEWA